MYMDISQMLEFLCIFRWIWILNGSKWICLVYFHYHQKTKLAVLELRSLFLVYLFSKIFLVYILFFWCEIKLLRLKEYLSFIIIIGMVRQLLSNYHLAEDWVNQRYTLGCQILFRMISKDYESMTAPTIDSSKITKLR